jgi:aminoglycoside 6-adenylyltransferase
VDGRVSAFLDEVTIWARSRDDVHAALLVGSQARPETPADELSDVDLVLFVSEPERYLGDTTWLGAFGEPLLTFVEPTAVGGFEERRVLFRDGLEVDFSLLPATAAGALPPDAEGALAPGFSVLHDELGLDLEPPAVTPTPPPSQAALDRVSNDFWYHLLWAAKKLRRGEVLLAKQACDCYLTALLVELLRWRSEDAWHRYRFFERWAGEGIPEALQQTFARYEADDIARALRAKGELFGELEHELAQRFGLDEPVDRGEVLRRLEALLSPRADAKAQDARERGPGSRRE